MNTFTLSNSWGQNIVSRVQKHLATSSAFTQRVGWDGAVINKCLWYLRDKYIYMPTTTKIKSQINGFLTFWNGK